MQKFLLFITGLLFIGCTSKLNDDNLPAGFSWNLLIKNAGNLLLRILLQQRVRKGLQILF
jgi:hypothetical protein